MCAWMSCHGDYQNHGSYFPCKGESCPPDIFSMLGTERVAGAGLVIDAFCGVGGNAVHFARRCAGVLGLDHNAARLALAAHNAGVYGVAQYLELVCSDIRTALPRMQA